MRATNKANILKNVEINSEDQKAKQNNFHQHVEDTKTVNSAVGVVHAGTNILPNNAHNFLSTPGTGAGYSLTMGIASNYIDSLCAIMMGVELLRDEENHRQTQNKIRGITNILAGVETLMFYFNAGGIHYGVQALAGAGALAGPACTLGTMLTLVNATMDYMNAWMESTFEGWLDDQLDQVKHIEKRLADPKTKEEKKVELQQKKTEIYENIGSRCRVHCHTGSPEERVAHQRYVEKKFLNNPPILDIFTAQPSKKDRSHDEEIQKKLNENLKTSKENLMLKSIRLAAGICLSVASFVSCPPLLIAGSIVMALLSVHYIYKNGGSAFCDKVSEKAGSFFGSSKKKTSSASAANDKTLSDDTGRRAIK